MKRVAAFAILMTGCTVWIPEHDAYWGAQYHQASIYCYQGARSRYDYDACMKRVETHYDLRTVPR